MTITREQVADLQPGDVVELRRPEWPDTVIAGPLRKDAGGLGLAWFIVRTDSGECHLTDSYALTVVSRAPRPLYVNHSRTEPVPGDVVRASGFTYLFTGRERFAGTPGKGQMTGWVGLPACHPDTGPIFAARQNRLRLLVDGSTGEVVQ